MSKIVITANQDERIFKKDDKITLDIKPGINFMVGPNGSGKTTIMRAIRAHKDSLYDALSNSMKMDTVRQHEMNIYNTVFDVQGLEEYEHVLCLDAQADDPMSMNNSATACSFIHGGGFNYSRMSRGEGTRFLIAKFLTNAENVTGANVKEKKQAEKRSLIILDEVDEGMDINNQLLFAKICGNMCKIQNADMICICHNPICILASPITMVYDMGTRSYKDINKYIKEQTGKEIIIKDINK